MALHGYIDPEIPDRSALVFAPENPIKNDGLLQVREIRNLRLNADLVTLSACDTGVGPVGEEGAENIVNAFFDVLSPGVLHILYGTISVALAERLTVEHASRGIDLVGASVFGRPSDAEAGQLWIVVAGADKAVDHARPLLATFSRGITVVGKEPQQAYAIKPGTILPLPS